MSTFFSVIRLFGHRYIKLIRPITVEDLRVEAYVFAYGNTVSARRVVKLSDEFYGELDGLQIASQRSYEPSASPASALSAREPRGWVVEARPCEAKTRGIRTGSDRYLRRIEEAKEAYSRALALEQEAFLQGAAEKLNKQLVDLVESCNYSLSSHAKTLLTEPFSAAETIDENLVPQDAARAARLADLDAAIQSLRKIREEMATEVNAARRAAVEAYLLDVGVPELVDKYRAEKTRNEPSIFGR